MVTKTVQSLVYLAFPVELLRGQCLSAWHVCLQPTNKYFIDLLKEDWVVVVNEATGKPQVGGGCTVVHYQGVAHCTVPSYFQS